MFLEEGYNSPTNLASLTYEKSHMKQCSSYAVLVRCEIADVPEMYYSIFQNRLGFFSPLDPGTSNLHEINRRLFISYNYHTVIHSLGVSGLRAANHFQDWFRVEHAGFSSMLFCLFSF